MKRNPKPLLWGVFLVAVGSLSLLHSTGLLRDRLDRLAGGIVLALIATFLSLIAWGDLSRRGWLLLPAGFLGAGATLLLLEVAGPVPDPLVPLLLMTGIAAPAALLHRLDRARRWALGCAWAAGCFGVALALEQTGRWGSRLAGPFLLAAAAAPFLWWFLRTGREWALIAGGAFLTLSLVATLDEIGAGDRLVGSAGFAALGATFAATFVLGRPGRVGWARWAALACLVLALGLGVMRPLVRYGFPLALIATGAWLIWGPERPRMARPGTPPSAPHGSG